MKLRVIHTVPVWDDHGRLHVCGFEEIRPDAADVVGWANVAEIEIDGETRHFLLVFHDAEDSRDDDN